jgi:hypothetical protein
MLQLAIIEMDTFELLPSLSFGRFAWEATDGTVTSHHFVQFSFITLGINLDIIRDITDRYTKQ